MVTLCAGPSLAGAFPPMRPGKSGQALPLIQGGSQLRRTGPIGPLWPARREPALEPLPAASARDRAPGAAWAAPDAEPAGNGTVGRSVPPWPGRCARAHGWRLISRGLVTGGVLICGWMLTGAAHAYASQITAPAAPHSLSGSFAEVPTAASSASGPAGIAPAAKRPASALLALPGSPVSAGAGAGIQDAGIQDTMSRSAGREGTPGGAGTAAGAGLAGSLTAVVCQASGVAVSAVSAPVRALVPLDTGAADQVATIGNTLGTSIPPTLSAAVSGRPGGSQTATVIGPAAGHGLQARGSRRRVAEAVLPLRRGSGWTGYAVAASRAGGRHPRPNGAPLTNSDHRKSRGPLQGVRLGLTAGTQTDPTSSGGGPGAAQVAVQVPPSAGTWQPAGQPVRGRALTWPPGRVGVDDPAVSPD
jgi:hypothetical protein